MAHQKNTKLPISPCMTVSGLLGGLSILLILITNSFTNAGAEAEEMSAWFSIELIGIEKLPETPEAIEAGKGIYRKKCVWCHGISGKGDGPITYQMGTRGNPRPRDFTIEIYKLRSTSDNELPTDEDLFLTITRGMPGTAMPSWRTLSDTQRWQLVYYIKTFSSEFQDYGPGESIKIGKVIPSTDESLVQGRKLYIEAKCWECHGNSGRGDGPAAKDQKNDKGDPLLTTDLTNPEAFKAGYSPRVIYRTLTTGLGGASMPSFSATLSTEKLWHLANYISSLAQSSDSQVLP